MNPNKIVNAFSRTALPAVLLLASSALLAAPPGEGPRGKEGGRHGPPSAEQQLAHLDRALDLSDQQSEELLTVLQAAEANRQALHGRISEEYKPELCAQKAETEAGILAVLTTEQAETFEQLKEERRGRSRRGGPEFDCD